MSPANGPDPYEQVTYSGVTLDRYTLRRLREALRRAGLGSVMLYQGSYHAGHGPSAGTHDGGGVLDINTNVLSATQKRSLLSGLEAAGFAAWLRPLTSAWPEHIHAVALGNARLSPQAAAQVRGYGSGASTGAIPAPPPAMSDEEARRIIDDVTSIDPGEALAAPLKGAVSFVFQLLGQFIAPLARWLASAGVMVLVALLGAWLIFSGARTMFQPQGAA